MAVAAATRLKLITSTGKIKNRCSCMVWRNNTKWKRVDTRCTRLQCATSNWLSESRNACALAPVREWSHAFSMVKGRHCLRMLYEGLLRALVLSVSRMASVSGNSALMEMHCCMLHILLRAPHNLYIRHWRRRAALYCIGRAHPMASII